MESIKDNEKIIIQGVTENSISIDVNGKTQEIEKKLDVLLALMKQQSTKSIQTADKIYNIGTITNANFGYIMGKAGHDKSLPITLSENLVGEHDEWIKILSKDLIKEGIPVGDDPFEIFQNYDWLIQVFLQKMFSPPGRVKTLYAFSFMAEAYQASLRYLCYVQIAQVLQLEEQHEKGILSDFIQMNDQEYIDFDYTSLLLTTTDLLAENGFMPEIRKLVNELKDSESDLFGAAFFLESERRQLLTGKVKEDEALPEQMEKYLTALVYWLKNVSFLANYRLVSIKDINLDYRIGFEEAYLHRYAQLHNTYNQGGVADKTRSIQIKGSFTYSKSILLFKGNVLAACLKNIEDKDSYISMSPLLIDKSVYDDLDKKQMPDIYYYSGYEKAGRKYSYVPYNKELLSEKKEEDSTLYPTLYIKSTNTELSGLDDLFEQLEENFNPFKIKTS